MDNSLRLFSGGQEILPSCRHYVFNMQRQKRLSNHYYNTNRSIFKHEIFSPLMAPPPVAHPPSEFFHSNGLQVAAERVICRGSNLQIPIFRAIFICSAIAEGCLKTVIFQQMRPKPTK